jgi:hypothetical protein
MMSIGARSRKAFSALRMSLRNPARGGNAPIEAGGICGCTEWDDVVCFADAIRIQVEGLVVVVEIFTVNRVSAEDRCVCVLVRTAVENRSLRRGRKSIPMLAKAVAQ